MVSIHLAQSNFLMREGLKAVCESTKSYQITSQSADWDKLSVSLKQEAVEVLILSTALEGMKLKEDLEQLRASFPELKIILVDSAQKKMDLQAIESLGVRCILHTDCAAKEILKGIAYCLVDIRFVCSRVTGLQQISEKYFDSTGKEVRISKREEDIIRLVAQGYTSKEISEKLILSFHTISTHRKNIFKKLKVNSAAELTRLVIQKHRA